MLQSLRVKNLAIADDVSVAFAEGLNVISGETGAGKSILAGALGLVLGARADRGAIRTGEDQCLVEAVFALRDSGAVDAALTELGLPPCEDGLLVIRRTIAARGTGRNFVNDAPVTVQALKSIGDLLVDQHGPHDHQSLLEESYQLEVLDAFGRLDGVRQAYHAGYAELLALRAERGELNGDDGDVARQIDLLTFQVDEITAAKLTPDEDAAVQQEHLRVANAGRLLELATMVSNALTEDDAAAFQALATAQRALAELCRIVPAADAWRDEAASIAIQIQELSASIVGFVQDTECDPERLEWLEDRMALIQKLKRKYGSTIPAILEFHDRTQAQLEALLSRGERIAALDRALEVCRQRIQKLGHDLRAQRESAGRKLGQTITAHLRDLGFAQGQFAVTVRPVEEPRPSGLDVVEFGFAPNVGEPMRSLKSIASSGEISRVMLAVKAVLADHDRIPVLVFDEIDANVGGETGNAIGAKLVTVAGTRQVICITHLPQVAVCGGAHFVVAKQVVENRTMTAIERVTGERRVEEVARMLGGRDQTSVALQHARELLARAAPPPARE
jgi:DNA repair protein RecN (Recombination protein N)